MKPHSGPSMDVYAIRYVVACSLSLFLVALGFGRLNVSELDVLVAKAFAEIEIHFVMLVLSFNVEEGC
jgi:hypothetical protein